MAFIIYYCNFLNECEEVSEKGSGKIFGEAMSYDQSRGIGGGSGVVQGKGYVVDGDSPSPTLKEGSSRVSGLGEDLEGPWSFDLGTLSWVSMLKGKHKLDSSYFNLLPLMENC